MTQVNGDARYDPQAVFELVARRLLARARLRKDDRLLDVACGSWVVGREAARRGAGFVAGMDLDLPRLRVGRSGTACQARAEALPFRDEAFSLVTCQHGLMFFDDRSACLREASRVLRVGGRFAATCWCALEENPGFLALHRAIAANLGPDAALCAARPFSLPDPEVVADEIAEAGFSSVTIEKLELRVTARSIDDFSSWYLLRTSLAPFVEGRGEAVASIRRRVAEDLATHRGPSGVEMPAKAYCVQARLP